MFGALITGLIIISALGLYAAHYMDSHGHIVTGMSNRVVWGVPHVFAIFLILAASGALNVASLASVFSREAYKPLDRMSGLMAISLLVGGLSILVLDLGRPDRLVIAMTHYNFKSIFAWNIYIYTGFIIITVVYLWMLMERRFNRYADAIGLVAFIWRLVLTTGTGCIFGFLVARESYDGAILAPLFIAMSLSFGLAVFVLSAIASFRWSETSLPNEVMGRFRRLLGWFSLGVLYLVIIQHLSNIYAPQHRAIERFFLLDGGMFPLFFWVGQIVLGTVAPIIISFHRRFNGCVVSLLLACVLVIAGGFCQLYVLIVGAQAYPLKLFGQFEVLDSSLSEASIATYVPSLPEMGLGAGGVALAILLFALGLKIFPCLPDFDTASRG